MSIEIIDLHSASDNGPIPKDVIREISSGLSLPSGQRELPTLLLYDERGLRLYDDITTDVPEYYLFPAEEGILKDKADEIVQAMHQGKGVVPGEVVVELGAGALRKTSLILSGLARLVDDKYECPPVTYYALDLEQRELERSLNQITKSNVGHQLTGKVATKGMWGTYDDGLKFLRNGGLETLSLAQDLTEPPGQRPEYKPSNYEPSPVSSGSDSPTHSVNGTSSPLTPAEGNDAPLHIMFLGSTLGNFTRSEATSFLRSLPLRPYHGDTLLLGLDHDNDKDLIELAYNDPQGYTKRFIFNGLRVAGRALGDENVFDETKWDYATCYNVAERQHEAYFKSKCDQDIYDPKSRRTIAFKKDELLKIEQSMKFSDTDAYTVFAGANLRPIQRWTDSKGQYSLWLLERPPFLFPTLSSPIQLEGNQQVKQYSRSPFGVPSRAEFKQMWAAWDFITMKMIPPSMLMERPIDLRHICLFYFGHIPTFLDIILSKLLKEPNTEPEHFKYIFERGIDPDVDDPNECHPHSEVPAEDEDWPSLSTILTFRNTVRARLMKVYDDIDSGKLPLTRRVGRHLFIALEHEATHGETLLYMLLQRAGTGTIPPPGFAVPPWESLKASWDLIPPPRSETVTLGPATVTLGHNDSEIGDETDMDLEDYEFGWDNEHPRRTVGVGQFKISWRPVTNGELYNFYIGEGKDKIKLPATWVKEGGKFLVRTLYGPVPMDIAQHWPVIAPYETLSVYAVIKGGRLPTEAELRLFYDKFECGYEGGANVGFRTWHPVPATTGGERAQGKGTNGGVWEWTSTLMDYVEGYAVSSIYPGYSSDFFDGKHHIVLNGSYATTPRLASRRAFRNWYQFNYPYAWIGGRIAYDVQQQKN